MRKHLRKRLISIGLRVAILLISLPISAYAKEPAFQTTVSQSDTAQESDLDVKKKGGSLYTVQVTERSQKFLVLAVWLVMIVVVLGILVVCAIKGKKEYSMS